ncbi:MAG: SH3 beta-barrel fold-containing protein [Candidatus Thorarchaeota archaeon]
MVLNPINPDELRQRLNSGTVTFAFKKLDGNLRTAVGTTSIETIPVDHHPKGGTSSDKVVVYFDLQKGEWRSVSVTREIFIAE